MDVTIAVDFGQGYQTYMTPEDARRLFETLKEVFEPKESLKKTHERIIQDLKDKGYEVYTASGATLKVEDQASPTEAPGTLHDTFCTQSYCACKGSIPGHTTRIVPEKPDQDCGCYNYASTYKGADRYPEVYS